MKWKCAECFSEQKPCPTPGVMNDSLSTIAEFCSDLCRVNWLRRHDAKRQRDADENRMSAREIKARYGSFKDAEAYENGLDDDKTGGRA